MSETTVRELVIVANRLPVRRSGEGEAAGTWQTSPGGLVAALEPAVRSSRTRWVGWTGVIGDDPDPFDHDDISLFPVALAENEVDDFYGGFSNSTLWPLYHDAIFIPQFHRTWWETYVTVNKRFADVAADVAPEGSTVWVHDYQLQLVPAMLRERRPDLRIGFYLHIPFPSQELFLRLPWRSRVMRGMLGADLIGFQTAVGAQNFCQIAARLLDVQVNDDEIIGYEDRAIHVGTFPVGINAEAFTKMALRPETERRVKEIRAELGDPDTVVLGVDRLDYTKGIEVRLRAYRELLDEDRIDPERCVLVQIAQPSRNDVPGYSEIRNEVEQLVGAINGDHSTMSTMAVKYLHQSKTFEELVALYRAADVMLVTPFRDGMNLVAKEYVVAKTDNDGVLILSEFAGAAHEMERAELVNPYDIDGMKQAIDHAVNGDRRANRDNMAALAEIVQRQDANAWASSFLAELEGIS